MTEYYRIIIDFSHEELGDVFDALLDKLSDAAVEILDPEHDSEEACARDWFMRGGSVTAEYELYQLAVENQYVGAFKDWLKETGSVDEFLEGISGHGEEI